MITEINNTGNHDTAQN